MDIQVRKEDKGTVVAMNGRMDALTAPVYQDRMNELIAAGEASFVVDLSGLDYISSAGLRAILTTAKLLKPKNGQVCFANLNGTVREVFEMSGFGSIFRMYDSVSAALEQ